MYKNLNSEFYVTHSYMFLSSKLQLLDKVEYSYTCKDLWRRPHMRPHTSLNETWACFSICCSFTIMHSWGFEVGASYFFQKYPLSPNIQAQSTLIMLLNQAGLLVSLRQRNPTQLPMLQFTNQAVHFSKLLKKPRNQSGPSAGFHQ